MFTTKIIYSKMIIPHLVQLILQKVLLAPFLNTMRRMSHHLDAVPKQKCLLSRLYQKPVQTVEPCQKPKRVRV
jgi:hypothetical protein